MRLLVCNESNKIRTALLIHFLALLFNINNWCDIMINILISGLWDLSSQGLFQLKRNSLTEVRQCEKTANGTKEKGVKLHSSAVKTLT